MRYTYTEARAKRVYNIANDLRGMYLKLYIADSDRTIAAKKENSPLLPIYKKRQRESLERAGACTALKRIFFIEYSEDAWQEMLTYLDIHTWKEGDTFQATMVKEILALAISAE